MFENKTNLLVEHLGMNQIALTVQEGLLFRACNTVLIEFCINITNGFGANSFIEQTPAAEVALLFAPHLSDKNDGYNLD